MKEKKIRIMDEVDERISMLLQEMGYNKKEARILVFLLGNKQGTSKEMEQATGLRQPEVSTGTISLMERKVLRRETIPTDTKGRPQTRFFLAVDVDVFLKEFSEQMKKEIESRKRNLDEITELLKQRGGA